MGHLISIVKSLTKCAFCQLSYDIANKTPPEVRVYCSARCREDDKPHVDKYYDKHRKGK
jgi:hypothetical protein